MDDREFEVEDVVTFELPSLEDAEAFADRFLPRWQGRSHEDGHLWLYTARLDTGPGVAGLLREAQELLAELGLDLIRFFLDGRVYVLGAAPTPGDVALPAKSA